MELTQQIDNATRFMDALIDDCDNYSPSSDQFHRLTAKAAEIYKALQIIQNAAQEWAQGDKARVQPQSAA